MDFKEIQELIRMVNKNNIAELTIENQDFRIKIKTALAASYTVQAPMLMPQMQQQPMTQQIQQVSASDKADNAAETQKGETANTVTIKSPIVGTFYRSAGPDKDLLVKVGDEIGVGTKLCIIEAMKLFNEIESEHSGRILKILVEDASPVEFDQPLFLIEPK